MTLPVLADNSLRTGIMLDLVETIAAMPEVMGVIDDVPFEEGKPPKPRPGHGIQAFPFAYVYEGPEQPNSDECDRAICEPDVTVELHYQFSKTDGANGMKPRGRALLAALQAAVMVDPNRGRQTLTNGDNVQRAARTREHFNHIEETSVDCLACVFLRLHGVHYLRDFNDPGQR